MHLQSLGGCDNVAEIYWVAEWVLVELGDAVQLTLSAAQLGDVGFEWDTAQVAVFLHQVTDPVMQPLP